jgi:predicted phosphodiesterase
MAKAPTNADLARALVKRFPDAPSKTLARRLYSENKERFPHLESARDSIRYARGNAGNHARKMASKSEVDARRPNGKSGWSPECPPSQAEAWSLVKIDGPARVLSLSDIHVPYHDRRAVEAAVKHGRKLKPDVVVLLGDIADFYNISRWEKDPKARDLKSELDTTKELLGWIRGQFPKARMIYKIGNHEQRWDKYIWHKAPELWNIANVQLHNMLDFEKYGIERVDDGVILAGELPMLHGHETGRSITSPVNPARGLFLRTKHTALIGHLHQTSGHGESDMWHKETFCWSQGALCDLCPPYLRINRWNHGMASVIVAADGQFDLSNYRLSTDYIARSA